MLSPDVVLLRRLHYSVAQESPDREVSGIVDVSAGDIRDLYLAADVLVTDYSSVMFDFAVTGKPIVLYVEDYQSYTTRHRQHYFDILEESPGPVATSAEELAGIVQDLPTHITQKAAQYRRFQQKFCPFDDGQATQRVIDRVFAGALS